jgi:hypothetical protein
LLFQKPGRFSVTARSFLVKGWYLDSIYSNSIGISFFQTAYVFCFKFLDQYFLKFLGPKGISTILYRLSKSSVDGNSGLISSYVFCLCYILLILLFITWLASCQ